MSTNQPRIVVAVDGTLGSDVAQRWAIDEARARKVPIRLVNAYTWANYAGSVPMYLDDAGEELEDLRRNAEQTIDTALAQDAAIGEDVVVTGEAVQGTAAVVMLSESIGAAMIVLGSRQLGPAGSFLLGSVSSEVAARASCPVVVTRGPAGYPAELSQVVAGVDATEHSQDVLSFAFDMASRHRVPLVAVLCWNTSAFAPSKWLPRGAEHARERATLWLSETMAGWREKYPEVTVSSRVNDQHPVSGLVKESMAQFLLVIGRPRRGVLNRAVLGSVSRGVLHHASCPVAVVPTGEDSAAE